MNKIFKSFRLLGNMQNTSIYLDSALEPAQEFPLTSKRSLFQKARKFMKNTPIMPLIIVLIVIFTIIFFTAKSLTKSQPQTVLSTTDQKVKVDQAKAQQALNREFLFPLKNAEGKEVSKLKYEIQTAELRDQIIIKGQKATAVEGRTFLILNLKITNDYNKSVQISVRDYLRLIVNNSSEKLAADIHNDPVEIQAISTKYTRVGFPINSSDTNLTLQVGEITGKKELVKLEIK